MNDTKMTIGTAIKRVFIPKKEDLAFCKPTEKDKKTALILVGNIMLWGIIILLTVICAKIAHAAPLTVSKSGSGTGTITSSPVGIDCGSTCSYDFPTGTVMSVVATPSGTDLVTSMTRTDTVISAVTDTKAMLPGITGVTQGAIAGGKIYIMSGVASTGLGRVQIYDIVNETWSVISAFTPGDRTYAVAGIIGGKIYIHGGYTGSYKSDTWEYDPGTDTWTAKAPGPVKSHHSGGVINGKLYVFGGRINSSTGSTETWEYDPVTDVWTKKANGPDVRRYAASAVLNGNLYIHGGLNNATTMQDTLLIYDPATDAWSTGATGPSARAYHAMTAHNGKLYVYGGPSYNAEVWEYDPSSNMWTQLPNITGRKDHLLLSDGSYLWAVGGKISTGNTALLHRLSIIANNTNSACTGSTCTYTTEAGKRYGVSATIVKSYLIAASAGVNGSITPAGNTALPENTSQTYTITPNENYHVADVMVDNVSVGTVSTYTFNNVTANHTINVVFGLNTYTITGSAGSNGSVTPGGIANVGHGQGQQYVITPNTGYHVDDVLVDNLSQGAITTYTFSDVTASHTISAIFGINNYTVTASNGNNGIVTPSGLTTLVYNTSQTYTITPVPGYAVVDVLVDGVSVGAVSTYTFDNIAANHTINATFGFALPVLESFSCPETGYRGQALRCNVIATAPTGTLTYAWTWPIGTVISTPTMATSDIKFTTEGEKVGKVRVTIAEDPTRFIEQTFNVSISNANLTATLNCPESTNTGTTITCTAVGTNSWGTLAYEWTSPSGMITPDNDLANITFSTAGTKTVSVKVLLTEDPAQYVTANKNVVVEGVLAPKISINGPVATYQQFETTFSAVPACPAGQTCTITWKVGDVVSETTGTQLKQVFAEVGTYVVQATAKVNGMENDPNMSVSASKTVIVLKLYRPQAFITAPNYVIAGESVTATVTLIDRYKNIESVGNWIFEDETTSTDTTITRTAVAGANGKMVLKYRAWLDGYEEDTVVETVKNINVVNYVFPYPKLKRKNINLSGIGPYTVVFQVEDQYRRTIGLRYNITYSWDFGDGQAPTVTTKPILIHTFNTGVYNIALTVTDDKGNSTADNITITVVDPPPYNMTFKVSPSNKYLKNPVSVFVKPAITGGHPSDRITSWAWTVNGVEQDRHSSSLILKLIEPGTYVVGLTITTKSGKISNGITQITVIPNQAPTCEIVVADNPKYKYTLLTAICTDPDGRIVGYEWDLGNDGTPFRGSNKVYARYTESGTYTVTLTATDNSGGTTTVTKDVEVVRSSVTSGGALPGQTSNPAVTLSASYSNTARKPPLGAFIKPVITGVKSTDPVTVFAWKINDNTIEGNRSSLSYQFIEPGIYTANLGVTTKSGATATGSLGITVYPNDPPACEIEAVDYPKYKYTILKAVCTDSDGRVVANRWDIGNGAPTYNGSNRVYAQYTESGTYTVTLTATDNSGGATTVTKDVEVVR